MNKALAGYDAIRLTTFNAENYDKGRGATDHTKPALTDGDVAVEIRYKDANGRQREVYVALVDIDAITAELRQGVEQEEKVLDSVRLRHIPSGFVRSCPLCGETTAAESCTELRQWLLPSPSLSIDKSTHIHTECCGEFADALEDVWQHTADGLTLSL